MHILLTVLHYTSYGTSKENISKSDQDISSVVITFFILITWMFEHWSSDDVKEKFRFRHR